MPAKTVKDILDLRRRRDTTGGFTLVELLVVIAIIGVLATLVLLQLGTARGRARDTKRIADVAQIRSAVEQYFEDNNGAYPTSIYAASPGGLGKYFSSGTVPMDPLTATKQYNYCVFGTNGYQVAAELEHDAAALNADSDLNPGITGCVNGGSLREVCTTSAITDNDCVYDVGTNS